MFLSRPKMAEALQDAILCFLVVFWGAESQLCIQSETAGGSRFLQASVCAYLRLRSSSHSNAGIAPLEWAQFLAKPEKDSWQRIEQLSLFLFPRSITWQSLRKLVSCLLRFCTLAVTFACPSTIKLVIRDLFCREQCYKFLFSNKNATPISKNMWCSFGRLWFVVIIVFSVCGCRKLIMKHQQLPEPDIFKETALGTAKKLVSLCSTKNCLSTFHWRWTFVEVTSSIIFKNYLINILCLFFFYILTGEWHLWIFGVDAA